MVLICCVVFLVPDQQTLKALLCREHALQHCDLVQRAFSLVCLDRYAVCSHIQHQVIREFGLPDSAVELLQSARLYTVNSCGEDTHEPQGVDATYMYSGNMPGPGSTATSIYSHPHHYIHQHSTPARHIHHAAQSPPQSPRILTAPHSHPVLLATQPKVPTIQQQAHKLSHLSRAISYPSGHNRGHTGCTQPCLQTGGNVSSSCSPVIHSGCVHPRSPALSPACRKLCQVIHYLL